ncbi:hypothetical protein CH373_18335 [Leptospira perolatii]|uniref:Chemotaxis protein n=1 Tax=Leptospira perolatii TaxID=2023191 RepID=A0A2M9ZHX6_9LEPT|nr:chemotaxis protein [Leptospira perolatii]PJZ69488.1 hypothetical protein CH360_10800 [Leptospira perolatii]PJZ71660.1 hypothetical protein CH373_18335 [Leptospira perolatii]
MEKQLVDAVNACLGILMTTSEALNKAKGEISQTYQNLITKGAADNSEPAKKARELFNKVSTEIKEISSSAEKSYESVRSKFDEIVKKSTSLPASEAPAKTAKKSAA